MQKYKCHKEVHAEPMDLGTYNEYRGWAIPDDEDPARQGYHVVYNLGTPSEYHSWTPKEELEKGYTPV